MYGDMNYTPKCRCRRCSNKTKFNKLSAGYRDFCCKRCEIIEISIVKWETNDPCLTNFKKSQSENWNNPEYRELMRSITSEKNRKMWRIPEYRELMKSYGNLKPFDYSNLEARFLKACTISRSRAIKDANGRDRILYVLEFSDFIKIGTYIGRKILGEECKGSRSHALVKQFSDYELLSSRYFLGSSEEVAQVEYDIKVSNRLNLVFDPDVECWTEIFNKSSIESINNRIIESTLIELI